MAATNILTFGPDYQWDSDSRYPLPDPGSAPNNCGPAVITNIANFYRDASYSIYATRRLAVTDPRRGTSASEQAVMLNARGVPCAVRWIDSISEIASLVGTSGRRPIVIGVLIGRFPWWVRDHPFMGWHAIEILARASGGFWYRDPNFSRAVRPDPDAGRKWITDAQLQHAYIAITPRYAIVPNASKVVSTVRYVKVRAGARIRSKPSGAGAIVATLSRALVLARAGKNRPGGDYSWWDGDSWATGASWVPVRYSGVKRWVIKPFASSTKRRLGMTLDDTEDLDDEGLLEGDELDASGPKIVDGSFIISEPVGDELAAPAEGEFQ
jgi:hypothetical protein